LVRLEVRGGSLFLVHPR